MWARWTTTGLTGLHSSRSARARHAGAKKKKKNKSKRRRMKEEEEVMQNKICRTSGRRPEDAGSQRKQKWPCHLCSGIVQEKECDY